MCPKLENSLKWTIIMNFVKNELFRGYSLNRAFSFRRWQRCLKFWKIIRWICAKLAAIQQVNTCSNSIIGTLENFVKYIQNKGWKHQDNASDVTLVSLFLTWTYFTIFFSVFIVDFK